MTITMYGIPNCDTIKKARQWLDTANIAYQFHDWRKDGVNAEMVTAFCQVLGWEQLVNKRGTTYRQLSQEQKAALSDATAIELLVAQPAMIKRPLLSINGELHLGFNAEHYASLFA